MGNGGGDAGVRVDWEGSFKANARRFGAERTGVRHVARVFGGERVCFTERERD